MSSREEAAVRTTGRLSETTTGNKHTASNTRARHDETWTEYDTRQDGICVGDEISQPLAGYELGDDDTTATRRSITGSR